jgi:hypothetical protein
MSNMNPWVFLFVNIVDFPKALHLHMQMSLLILCKSNDLNSEQREYSVQMMKYHLNVSPTTVSRKHKNVIKLCECS